MKRATIVGAVTKGGANAGRFTDVAPNFRIFISNAHATSAATGKTWDKVGIAPDIAVQEEDALTAAHREALRRLRGATTDAAWQRELDALLAAMR